MTLSCVTGVVEFKVDGFEKVLGRLSMDLIKVWNGLATCYAYSDCPACSGCSGSGQFDAPYCIFGPGMAATVHPLVRGKNPVQSFLLAPLMNTRRSNQRGSNTSLPYKHFHNMTSVNNDKLETILCPAISGRKGQKVPSHDPACRIGQVAQHRPPYNTPFAKG